jgi:hypothetical protein
MSTFTWTATGGGDWSTPTDWDIGTAPNDATAVAIIPGAPGAYTVTIRASDNQTINAITLGDFAGGHVGPTLEIAGSLTFAGNGPTLGFQSGLLQIDAGGVLAGQGLLGSGPQGSGVSLVNNGTVLANAGANTALAVVAPFTNNGTVLAGNGSVEIEGSTLTNLSGTTLTGGTWIAQGPTAGAFNQIELGFNFDAVIAIDAANIVLDGRASEILGYAGALHTGGNFQPIEQQLSSIAATGTLQLLNGRGYVTGNALDDAGSLILQGGTLATGGLTIDTNGTLAGFGVVTGSVANQGAILASGGVLDLTTPVSDIGVLGVTPGSTLVLNGVTAGEINNQGSIYAASGLLVDDGQLAGSGTLVVQNGATIEFFTGTSQNVAFSGSDATLRLDNFAGYHGALVGFAQGDSLVLAGTSATSAFVSGSSLVVMNNASTIDTVQLVGSYAPGAGFSVTNVGGNAIVSNTSGAPLRQDFAFTILPVNDTAGLTGQQVSDIVADLNAATLDWAQYLTGYTTLRIQLNILPGSQGAELANGGPTEDIGTATTLDGRQLDIASSLIALTTGDHAPGLASDITVNVLAGNLGSIYVNPAPTPTPSGTVPDGEIDLVSLFRHELAHGLGFGGLTTSQGALGPQETLFDHYIQDTIVNGTLTAAAFTGPNAEAAYAALIGTNVPTPVPLTILNNGEGFAHFANGPGDPTAGDLMSGLGLKAGTQTDISALDLAVLKDVGEPVTADVSLLCFCAGTRIATPTGEVPVEHLAPGDKVLTTNGMPRRIVWIGTGRTLVTPGHRSSATPVIVRKGALADGVPHRDLRITKGHSLFIDGVLIPAEFLVNHRSIVWDDTAREVAIYHLELTTHDVLLAEGAPAESYRDDGNRWLFHNTNTRWKAAPEAPCAPVLIGGHVVDRIWQRLLERTKPPLLPRLTEDADVHLLIDSRRLDAHEQHNGRYVFRLTGKPRGARIRSRSVVPQELGIARDPRRLGIALRRIVLVQPMRQRAIEAGDPRLSNGFHEYEKANGIRWTTGDAAIPPELFSGVSSSSVLIVEIAYATRYVDNSKHRRAA